LIAINASDNVIGINVYPGDTFSKSAGVFRTYANACICGMPASPVIPPTSVGGEVFPVNKSGILMPWLGLAFVLAAGGAFLMIKRQHVG